MAGFGTSSVAPSDTSTTESAVCDFVDHTASYFYIIPIIKKIEKLCMNSNLRSFYEVRKFS